MKLQNVTDSAFDNILSAFATAGFGGLVCSLMLWSWIPLGVGVALVALIFLCAMFIPNFGEDPPKKQKESFDYSWSGCMNDAVGVALLGITAQKYPVQTAAILSHVGQPEVSAGILLLDKKPVLAAGAYVYGKHQSSAIDRS